MVGEGLSVVPTAQPNRGKGGGENWSYGSLLDSPKGGTWVHGWAGRNTLKGGFGLDARLGLQYVAPSVRPVPADSVGTDITSYAAVQEGTHSPVWTRTVHQTLT